MRGDSPYTSSLYRGAIITTALFALGACATPQIEEAPTSAALPAIEKPFFYDVGYTHTSERKDGTNRVMTVLESNETTVTWETDNGCRFTSIHDNFAPDLTWTNCNNSGTQEHQLLEGQAYPLKLGNEWRYKVSGSNDEGGKWKTTRSCKVEGEVQITVPMGTYDTLKVVCRDNWRVRTWYMAPELGHSVFYSNVHPRRNETRTYALVNLEKAGS